MIEKIDAIISLVGLPEGWLGDGETVFYKDDQTPPTDVEIDAEVIRLQAEYDAQEYARNRALAFPSIGDQLDMQYWDQVNGTTTWKDAIAKIKEDNPKPKE